MPTDPRDSIHAAVAGDAHALESLFGRNMPKLMGYIRMHMGPGLSAKESVSDIAQSVCREVLQDMGDFEYHGEEAFRRWLFMQTTRKLADRHRYFTRQRRDMAREVHGEHHGEQDGEQIASILECYADFRTPSQGPQFREQLEHIENSMHQLPDSQREAVMLVKFMGLTYSESAQQLDCTESAIRNLVSRGVAKLAILMRG